MRIREELKEKIRVALLQAGTELIEAHGLEATTVEAITSRAGVAKGTFYNYFKTKDDLVYAAVQEGARGWEEELARIFLRHTSTLERLQAAFEHMIAWVEKHPELTWIWLKEGLRRMRSPDRNRSPLGEILRRVFAAGQEAGEIRPGRPPEEFAHDLGGLFLVHAARAYSAGRLGLLRETMPAALETYVHGALERRQRSK